jgi:DNA-binding MarR family transcriptional regulator
MMLDPMFHQVVRTRLAVLLAAEARSFAQLKAGLGVTDGNLDAHLRKLSAAGYLHSRMIAKRRPHTIYELSPSGRAAFEAYCQAMQELLFDAVNEGK